MLWQQFSNVWESSASGAARSHPEPAANLLQNSQLKASRNKAGGVVRFQQARCPGTHYRGMPIDQQSALHTTHLSRRAWPAAAAADLCAASAAASSDSLRRRRASSSPIVAFTCREWAMCLAI